MRSLPRLALAAFLAAVACPVVAFAAGGSTLYLDGLDQLLAGRPCDAQTVLAGATGEVADDADLVLARGVAATLCGKPAEALPDFTRVGRLRGGAGGRDRELEIWTRVAKVMQSGPSFETSMPGHLIQGGADYSTDYASFVWYEMAEPYGKAVAAGADPRASKELVAAITQAGRWFANLRATRADLAPLHRIRARERLAAGRARDALDETAWGLAALPHDPDLLAARAEAWLALGRPETARRAFTRALTERTTDAAAYAGRARAAARLGDEPRARADVAVLERLDPARVRALRAEVDGALARARSAGTVSARRRWDEGYQDRLRTLEDAVREARQDPPRRVALAAFLVEESRPLGEAVEPRRPPAPYRPAFPERELTSAIARCDEALAMDPRSAAALIQKALALTELGRDGEAEPLADQALRLAGDEPVALRLYARFRLQRARNMEAQAASLRTPVCSSSTRTENRSDGVWEITSTSCTQPSSNDIAQAGQLEAQAQALRQRAAEAIRRAIAASKGTVEGELLEAEQAIGAGDAAAARAHYEAALRLDPRSLAAYEGLATLLARTGDAAGAARARASGRNLIHTTAAPWLSIAWSAITATRYEAGRAALDEAAKLDPADARVPAYRGVLLESQGRRDEAIAAYRSALALEEAALARNGGVGSAAPLDDPLALGLALAVRLRLGPLLGAESAAAAALYRASEALDPLLPSAFHATAMFTAMLPDPTGDLTEVPRPPNLARLLAESHVRSARLASGPPQVASYQAAARLGWKSNRPRVGNAAGDTNFGGEGGTPVAEALLALAKIAIAAGETDRAAALLGSAGESSPTDAMRRELNELNLAVARGMNDRIQAERDREYEQQREEVGRELERQQSRERQSEDARRSGAKVDPELVGTWSGTLTRYERGQGRNATEQQIDVVHTIEGDGRCTIEERRPTGTVTLMGQLEAWRGRYTFTEARSRAATRYAYRLLNAGTWGGAGEASTDRLQLTGFEDGSRAELTRNP